MNTSEFTIVRMYDEADDATDISAEFKPTKPSLFQLYEGSIQTVIDTLNNRGTATLLHESNRALTKAIIRDTLIDRYIMNTNDILNLEIGYLDVLTNQGDFKSVLAVSNPVRLWR